MENLIIIPKDKNQLNFLKELFKQMKVEFKSDISRDGYSPELEEIIKKGREDKRKGNLIEVDPHNLWQSIGLD